MKFFNLYAVCVMVLLSIICKAYGGTYELDGSDEASARLKREHGHGVTGPVHTFVKTDKHANFKWGVRHHVGHKYAGRR